MKARAREHTDIGSLHREGKELAIKQVAQLCERSRAVHMVGVPKVEAVFVEDK